MCNSLRMAAKRLSMVEVDILGSNQHELNGVASLRNLLGDNKMVFNCHVYYMNNNGCELQRCVSLTWYDARESNRERTEYRLYYQGDVFVGACVGDALLVIRDQNNPANLSLIIIAQETGLLNVLSNNFGFSVNETEYCMADGAVLEHIIQALQNAGYNN